MKKIALVRGTFLNPYEMQSFEPLANTFSFTAFSSLFPISDTIPFPVVHLTSPMDLPDFPYKMPMLNRICIDAHYLLGLEKHLEGFDLVHSAETYYHYTIQSLNAKKRGIVKKVIATVLENISHNNEGIWGRKAFKKRSREELDHIIALTNLTKLALISEGADEKKITVIGHGIDTKQFYPRKNKKINSPLVILFSGRLERYKGIYEIIEAASILLKISPVPVRFVIVGEGSEKRNILYREKQLGISQYITHMVVPYSGMPEIYRSADIFVAPSKRSATWMEQYCTVLLEAQASGLPIVTTKSGGIPENVGEVGVYVPEGNGKELAKALLEYIKNSRFRIAMGEKSRHRATTVHDCHIIANKIKKVYDMVLQS